MYKNKALTEARIKHISRAYLEIPVNSKKGTISKNLKQAQKEINGSKNTFEKI